MVPWPNLLAFGLASVLLIILPGPSVLFVLGRSIALGRRGGLLSVLGNALGMLPAIAAVALGIGALVAQSVVVFTIVKIVGAAYLVFLGIQAIRHRKARAMPDASVGPAVDLPPRARGLRRRHHEPEDDRVLRRGAAAVRGPRAPARSRWQLAELGLIFFLLALVMDGAWALIAGTARDWFARSPKRVEHLGAAGGVMMIGLGGTLLVTGAKS